MNFFGFLMHSGEEIDLAPLVDIAFLLLTFFMMTTVFRATDKIQVETPQSNSAAKEPTKRYVIVTVSDSTDKHDTQVVVNMDEYKVRVTAFQGTPYEREATGTDGVLLRDWRKELYEILLRARQADPGQSLVLKADKNARFGVINEIMIKMKEVKFDQVQMVTKMEQ
ncbi:MAG: biopolymer transporter ExbD [Candidatus Thermochlorobacter aerophilum]|jgi:biopolymer transport protein ExbD|uniref:Biopolymer transporter ExbD n=1 Tax=Candidatus Thermochlorobacter aerophilus TaxID=1868324 RepID=A0A395LW60_9BACT|nr:MAG: biopolymer transporter ExbD [Candidatus Thermochlorobacter aerophilum]